MSKYILGIDPGKSGGFAILDYKGVLIDCAKMQLVQIDGRDIVDTGYMTRFSMAEGYKEIVIEKVSAMPGQGVVSMFNFGRFTGAVESWALQNKCDVHLISPQRWKRAMGLSKDKQASLDLAREIFGSSEWWDYKSNDGVAEAALLAYYHLFGGV